VNASSGATPLDRGAARPAIRVYDATSETFTSELCHIVEMSNDADDPAASIARARVEPGVTTRWHRLVGTVERYVMIEGRATVEIGDLGPRTLGPGDVVVIPPMVRQRIMNTGASDLVFLAICTPRFRQENYEEIDERGGAEASR